MKKKSTTVKYKAREERGCDFLKAITVWQFSDIEGSWLLLPTDGDRYRFVELEDLENVEPESQDIQEFTIPAGARLLSRTRADVLENEISFQFTSWTLARVESMEREGK